MTAFIIFLKARISLQSVSELTPVITLLIENAKPMFRDLDHWNGLVKYVNM